MPKLKKTKKGHVLTLDPKFNGEAFFEARKKALKVLEGEDPRLILDLSGLDSLTAWAVSFLEGARKTADRKGGEVSWKGLSQAVREAADEAGLPAPSDDRTS